MLRQLILYPKNIFRFIRPVHVHLKMDKVDLKKKHDFFCIFLQSPYQVDMKNVVECQKDFIAYFNVLKTNSEKGLLTFQIKIWRRGALGPPASTVPTALVLIKRPLILQLQANGFYSNSSSFSFEHQNQPNRI